MLDGNIKLKAAYTKLHLISIYHCFKCIIYKEVTYMKREALYTYSVVTHPKLLSNGP